MHVGADVGGTKTNLALVDARDPSRFLCEDHVASSDYGDLAALVRGFLARAGATARTACLAVPGPVLGGRAELTNLAWVCVESDLARDLGLRHVRLINDLVATATGIDLLPASDVVTIHPGAGGVAPEAGQVRAVIAPGTGLGEAFCVHNGERWLVRPAEGGHAAWAPRSEVEADLWHYIYARDGFVSVESVCSGLGLANIWRWLGVRGRGSEAPSLTQHIHTAPDPTRAIMEHRADSERCALAIETVVDHLAGEAADIAVRLLPAGGIFLAGGLPPRLLPLLQGDRFLQCYLAHPRLGYVHRSVPVRVVMNPKAALFGTIANGLDFRL